MTNKMEMPEHDIQPLKPDFEEDDYIDWKKILISDEFLYLYFNYLGVNECLSVERMSDIFEIERKKRNDTFRFAIVKTKKETNLEDAPVENVLLEEDLKVKATRDLLIQHNILIFHPSEAEDDEAEEDESLKFLSLAYSGMVNVFLSEDKTKLQTNSIKTNTFNTFINDIKHKLLSPNLDLYSFDSNDYFLKTNKDLVNEHNKFIESLCQSRLEKVFENNANCDNTSEYSYNLFFIKNEHLFEFRSREDELKVVSNSVNNINVRRVLLEYLIAQNESKQTNYLNDITIFSEVEEDIKGNEKINLKSEGAILIFLISFIFIFNFLIINPDSVFYDLKVAYVDFFEKDNLKNDLIKGQVSTINDLKVYFNDVILDYLYKEDNMFKFTMEDSSDPIIAATENSDTSSKYDYNQLNPNNTSYFILYTNYYCGMMVNYKISNNTNKTDFHNNTVPITQTSLGYFSSTPVLGPNIFDPDEKTDTENQLYPDTYKLYFKPNMNMHQKEWFRDQINIIFTDDLSDFSYTIFLYNSNYNVAIIYSMKFSINSFGEMTNERFLQGYMPFLMQVTSSFVTIIILNIIYFIGTIYIAFMTTRNVSNSIIELIRNHNYTFEWYDWVDIFVLIMSLCSQFISCDLIMFKKEVFPISLTSEEEFLYWLSVMLQKRLYLRITGLAILLIMVRFIRNLYTSFPHFGIVFDTMQIASKEILAFITMVCFMLIITTVMAHISFGWYSQAFYDFVSSLITIFLMFVGIFNYTDFVNDREYNTIAPYFFLFFMCFFYLIITQVFLCIIKNNYALLKEKTQNFNMAFGLILADKSESFNKKMYNFVACRDPVEIEEEERHLKAKESSVTTQKESSNHHEEDEENQVKKNTTNVSLWQRIMYNFKRLNLYSFIHDNDHWDNEAFEKEKKNKYKQIYRVNVLESIEEIEFDYEGEFDQLLQFFFYIIYIAVFISLIFIQLRFSQSSMIEKYVKSRMGDLLGGENINLENWGEVQANIHKYIELTYNYNGTCYNNTEFNVNSLPFYGYLKAPYFRITFRFYLFVLNSQTFENQYFPALVEDPVPLDSDNCNSISEERNDLSFYINEDFFQGNLKIKYSLPSDKNTPDNCGGYVYLANSTCPYCISKPDRNFTLLSNYFFERNVGSLTIDTILFPLHQDFIIYTKNLFVKQTLGNIAYNLFLFSIPINKYISPRDFMRFLMEMAFLVFTFYYLMKETAEIYEELKVILKKDFEDYSEKENFVESNAINKFIRLDLNKHVNDPLFKFLSDVIYLLCKKFVLLLCYFLVAVFRHLKKDFFNVVNIFSLLTSIIIISIWIDIILTTSIIDLRNYTFPDEEEPDYYNLQIASLLTTQYQNYVFWLSLNSFIIIVQFLQYFKFSKSVYSLISIISRSKFTIIFHFIFMVIINIGFAFMGFAIYGHNLHSFSSFPKAFLQMIVILAGDVDYKQLDEADSGWTGVYIILFSIVNFLILMNVLTSIVIEAYKEIKVRQQQNVIVFKKMNFIENVLNIIRNKRKIFMDRSELYYHNMNNLISEIKHFCFSKFKKTLKEVNQSYIEKKKSGFMTHFQNITIIRKIYIRDVITKIKSCEATTCSAEYYTQNIEANEFTDVEIPFDNKARTCDSISIWTKFMIYISFSIGDNIFSSNTNTDSDSEHNENSQKKKKNYLSRQTTYRKISKAFHSSKSILKDREEIDDRVFKVSLFKNRIAVLMNNNSALSLSSEKWLNEIKNSFKDSFQTNDSSLIKPDLLNKLNHIRISKALKHKTDIKSFNQIYEIGEVDYDSIYNTNFFVPCANYPQCLEDRKNCECEYIRNFYESIAVLIFDCVIKYFHVPYDCKIEDKELILGHYFLKLKRIHKNDMTLKEFSKLVCKEKINLFENDILSIKNLSKCQILLITDIEKNESNDDKNVNINFEENKLDMLNNLYKFFAIWNTLFLIFFKKNTNYLMKIKEKSLSYKIFREFNLDYGDDQNEIKENLKEKYDNYYQAILYKFYNLHRDLLNSDKVVEGFDLPNHKSYSTYIKILVDFLKREHDFNLDYERASSAMLFYEDPEKYLLRQERKSEYSDILPREEDSEKSSDNEFYPGVLEKLWHSLHQLEKFFIFFGYNKYILEEVKIDNFLKNDFLNENSMNFEIYDIFTSVHQAEIMKILEFPKFFNNILLEKFEEFLDKNKMNDNKVNKVERGREVLKFFHQMKLNYVKYYDFVTNIIDSLFKQVKRIVNKTNQEFNQIFLTLIAVNEAFFNNADNKLEFVKFYKLYLCRAKFDRLNSFFERSNENDSDSDNDEDEEDEEGAKNNQGEKNEEKAFKKFEAFIFACSLGPIELLNVIKCMDDEILKEFYMFLFIYLHYEDPDYIYFLNYLKKSVKIAVIEKYKKYSQYLAKREDVMKMEDSHKSEENINRSTLIYMKEMKSRIQKLEEMRHKLIEKINSKIIKQTKY